MGLDLNLETFFTGFKSPIIFTLVLLPFFYLGIYLFDNSIPMENYYLMFSVCFCLSLEWYAANCMIVMAVLLFHNFLKDHFMNKYDPSKKGGYMPFMDFGGLLSVALIFVSFFLSYLFGLKFKLFLVLSHLLLIPIIFIALYFIRLDMKRFFKKHNVEN